MQICYLVPGALSRHPGGEAEIERRRIFLETRSLTGAQVVLHDNPQGPASIESAAEEELAAAGALRLVPGIVAEGCDAIIIGCFGDPGLHAARELASVPVIGPAQASIHLAAQLGDRFGIVTVVQEVVPTLRRLVRAYGLEASLAAVLAVDVPVLELRQRREESLERLVIEGQRALAAGADALVLGCMTMGFLDVASDLQTALDIPVVNPVTAALHSCETIVAAGLKASPLAYPHPPKEVPFG